MLKAIMAVDDNGGVSKSGSMPWPKNSGDLQWFKKNTINQVVIMGRLTWVDPMIPTPLPNRINILVTKKSPSLFPGANDYISDNLKVLPHTNIILLIYIIQKNGILHILTFHFLANRIHLLSI